MTRRNIIAIAFYLLTRILTLSSYSVFAQTGETLRQAVEGSLIGCAITSADLENPELVALVTSQFNCITPENEFMPHRLTSGPDVFAFTPADRVVQFATKHDLPVFGHMLLWNYKTPRWLFQKVDGEPLPRTKALANLRHYIKTVAGHFQGKIQAWNVVNEAISDVPGDYLRDTPALRAIGEDYVAKAFQFAHAADPDAELYYNDYNIEQPGKREKALYLIRSLKAQGIRIDAVGIQGHWLIDYPSLATIDDGIRTFTDEGLKVMITELDIDVLPRTFNGAQMETVEHGPNPYPDGLPDNLQNKLAQRYSDIFTVLEKHPAVTSITFWGPHDGRSWLNDFPVKGRTNHALLFDRYLQPKPAYYAIIDALQQTPNE
jgi:endo-1,4-beta-xylanase